MGNCFSTKSSNRSNNSQLSKQVHQGKGNVSNNNEKDQRKEQIRTISGSLQGSSSFICLPVDEIDKRIALAIESISKKETLFGLLFGGTDGADDKHSKSDRSSIDRSIDDNKKSITRRNNDEEGPEKPKVSDPLLLNQFLWLESVKGAILDSRPVTTGSSSTHSCPNLRTEFKDGGARNSSEKSSDSIKECSSERSESKAFEDRRRDSFSQAIIGTTNSVLQDGNNGLHPDVKESNDRKGDQELIAARSRLLDQKELPPLPEECTDQETSRDVEKEGADGDGGQLRNESTPTLTEEKEIVATNVIREGPPPYRPPPPPPHPKMKRPSWSEENLTKHQPFCSAVVLENRENSAPSLHKYGSTLSLLRHPSLARQDEAAMCQRSSWNLNERRREVDLKIDFLPKSRISKPKRNRRLQRKMDNRMMILHDNIGRRDSLERHRRCGIMAGSKDCPRIELLDTQGRITESIPRQHNRLQYNHDANVISGHRIVSRKDAHNPIDNCSRKRKNSPNPVLLEGSTTLPLSSKNEIFEHLNNNIKRSDNRNVSSSALGINSKNRGFKSYIMEAIENSETESTKTCSRETSAESVDLKEVSHEKNKVTSDLKRSTESFPSFHDDYLTKLSIHKQSPSSVEHMTSDEIECKFNNISLAFKTDRQTLKERLESHQRQRDIAEKNIESEHANLKTILNNLSHTTKDVEITEKIVKILQNLDIFIQSVSRLSSRAEAYGSVQQEDRISKVVDVVFSHAYNMSRDKDKAQHELMEARHLLTDNRRLLSNTDSFEDDLKTTNSSNSIHKLPSPSTRSGKSRRASLAALPRVMYDNVMVGLGHLFPSSSRLDCSMPDMRNRCFSSNAFGGRPESPIRKVSVTLSSSISSPNEVMSRRTSLPVGSMSSSKLSADQHYRLHHPEIKNPALRNIQRIPSSSSEPRLAKIESFDKGHEDEENNNVDLRTNKETSVEKTNSVSLEVTDANQETDDCSVKKLTICSRPSIADSVTSTSTSPGATPLQADEDVFSQHIFDTKQSFKEEIKSSLERTSYGGRYNNEPCANCQYQLENPNLYDVSTNKSNSVTSLQSYLSSVFSPDNFKELVDWKQLLLITRFTFVGILLFAAVIALLAPFSYPISRVLVFIFSKSPLAWSSPTVKES